MGAIKLDDILVTPLRRVQTVGGDVLHAMKSHDPGFGGFGEAYFSLIEQGAVKAWKLHQRMTLNLVVPQGEVRFVFHVFGQDPNFRTEIIGPNNYVRLTVPPGIWFGFQGLAFPESLVLNIADIPHDPEEVLREQIMDIQYDWSIGK